MKKNQLLHILVISAFMPIGGFAQPNEQAGDAGSKTASTNADAYPEPLTVNNISDKDRRDVNKVSEALANTFLNAFQKKEYTQEEITRSTQMLTTLTCIQYNRMRQIESSNPTVPVWEVKASWVGPEDKESSDLMEVQASTRDLAAGYAMCLMWNMKHVPLDRFTGFHVEPVENKLKKED